jgi:hypothetical protein
VSDINHADQPWQVPNKFEDRERVFERIAIPGGQPCPKCGGPTQRWGHPLGWKPPALMPVWYTAWDRCTPCRHSWFDDAFRCTQVVPPTPPVAPVAKDEPLWQATPERQLVSRSKPSYAGSSKPNGNERTRHPGDWPYSIAAPHDPVHSGWRVDRTGRSNYKKGTK